jgi:hypothetical protein
LKKKFSSTTKPLKCIYSPNPKKSEIGNAFQCRGEVAQTMYTSGSKCKNDKIKGERKIK